MKKRLCILLTSLIGFTLYSHLVLANIKNQCLLNTQNHVKHPTNIHSKALPIHVRSNKSLANYPKNILFSGNVNIKHGNSNITADEVQITQIQKKNKMSLRIITANGNVNYTDNEIKLKGPKASFNLNTKYAEIYQSDYQILGQQSHGHADNIKQYGNSHKTVLKNGSFTSCPPGDNSWRIVGSEIIYEKEREIIKIWNARFEVGRIPIFYSPYLQIPLDDKSHSGSLIPEINYNKKNGIEFRLPYYLNITPNCDAIITPSYVTKNSIQIQTTLHYLNQLGDGFIDFAWLPKWRTYENKIFSEKKNYWFFSWYHNGTLDQMWRFKINYTKISDFNDSNKLFFKYKNIINNYAMKKFSLSYINKHWSTKLSYKNFQPLERNNINYYRAIPQFDFTYYKDHIGPFYFKIFSQASNLTNLNKNYPKAIRLHIEPTLNFILTNRWISLNTEAKIMVTHYWQSFIDFYNKNTATAHHLKNSVNRILPQLKTDAKVIFERNINYAPDYTQTLEPRMQYLYIPYHEQNNIGIYDSDILQSNYSRFFCDRTYSGFDRISSANQLTSSITTRIYDNQHTEQLNASLGQIYYFLNPPPCHAEEITTNWNKYDNNTGGGVIWAGDAYCRINYQLGVLGSLQYDSRLKKFTLGNALLEYRYEDSRILQINYRYTDLQYIKNIPSNIKHFSYQKNISQIGVTGIWPLIEKCFLVGIYYYDINTYQPINQLIGIQYSTCCWTVNAGYERKIANWGNFDNFSQYDNKISFNVELHGFRKNNSLSKNQIFKSSILPYQ